jgi:hypothetical protein
MYKRRLPGGHVSTRDELHTLIDRLPDETLAAVGRYLLAVEAGMPADIAEDEVPLSPEEEEMLASSADAVARGDIVTHEELGQRLAARRERA